ncbi:MAG: sel1 repeat family protein, partial [Neisseriaceae bacterium]|nr:sel1 repeat family protein [Neisseriaceae bacterium]
KEEAKEILTTNCARGYAPSCVSLADRVDRDNALEWYRTACDDLDYSKGCFKLGNHYENEDLLGNLSIIKKYYHKVCSKSEWDCDPYNNIVKLELNLQLCNNGDPESCYNAAWNFCKNISCLFGSFMKSNNPDINDISGTKLLEKACNGNVADACFSLGRGAWDTIQATKFYEKACNLGHGSSCYDLGQLYQNGSGIRHNNSTAKEYYGKACDLGLQQGCDWYKKLNIAGY